MSKDEILIWFKADRWHGECVTITDVLKWNLNEENKMWIETKNGRLHYFDMDDIMCINMPSKKEQYGNT